MAAFPRRIRTNIAAVSLVAAGLVGGGVLASTVVANAADSPTPSSTATTAPAAPGDGARRAPSGDQSRPQRPDEKLLAGSDATKARAAALAKYPGATIERVETDSDGVYEAHIVTKAGERLTVKMDQSFAVTGSDSHGARGAESGA
jgi:hypothetical protein